MKQDRCNQERNSRLSCLVGKPQDDNQIDKVKRPDNTGLFIGVSEVLA